MKRFYWVVISLLFFSCENEIGRVDLLKNNAEEVQFELQEGDVISLYTEIDIEYIKKPLFVYQFEFFKDGYPLYSGGIDPLVTTENKNETYSEKDGIVQWKFYGKLQGEFKADTTAIYSIKPSFIKNKEEGLKINKADIFFVK
ncbi:MAG: hypothetical protein COB15_10245 [Flavobacteriales bacterium]|nr:MAG: hypothetical protein COB15_10245 [Flavobacteriales bacterium]